MANLGNTEANEILERLLKLDDGDLRNALGIAKEYADHRSVAGVQNLPSGKRLLTQIKFGLEEVEQMVVAREAKQE